jgi:hypothetical protein
MPGPVHSRTLFFPLTVVFCGLFIVTILALVAVLFGEPEAPVTQLLDRFGGWLLGLEVVGILLAGFLALAVDRGQTLAAQSESAGQPLHAESPHEQTHPGGN